mgnify:CR=1 FL=1
MKPSIKGALKRYLPKTVSGLQDLRGILRASYYRLLPSGNNKYVCPICGYQGPFLDHQSKLHSIHFTECPRCGSYERHRLQYLVMMELNDRYDFSKKSILHFAPEKSFERVFDRLFAVHHTADIAAEGVDFKVDICQMPFDDGSYDVIYASHVLEHVVNDLEGLAEIRRVLAPNGLAILPVPVVSPHTIEYSKPNPQEFGHVRAIGPDYFERYKKFCSNVEIWKSTDFDEIHQLFTYENRSNYPSSGSPLRVPMQGNRHLDYVPVCFR